MKIGIVLPSFIYSDVRRRLACDAFASLANSEPLKESASLLLLVRTGTAVEYRTALEMLSKNFRVVLKTDEGLEGTEQTLAFGTQWLIENVGVEYVTWMGDDALFHPMWLWKLESLIRKHPTAKSWSVYRSAFEFVHRTLNDKKDDVLVRSICGHGMTFTKQEWLEWGIKWNDNEFFKKAEVTLDVLHSETRPGERWVTKKSYVQHTGKVGVHCSEGIPEHARDFQLT